MAIQSTGSLRRPQMATMTSPDDSCRDSLSSGRPPGRSPAAGSGGEAPYPALMMDLHCSRAMSTHDSLLVCVHSRPSGRPMASNTPRTTR